MVTGRLPKYFGNLKFTKKAFTHDIVYCIIFRFLILGALSALVVLYRAVIIISPRMRAYLLYIRFRLIKREVINTIVKKSKMGDWFLFYMLGQVYLVHTWGVTCIVTLTYAQYNS